MRKRRSAISSATRPDMDPGQPRSGEGTPDRAAGRQAGFIFGGSGGRGVLVARDGRAWAGPAFYNLATASVGFQAGVDVSEVIIVVMTDRGFNSLLSTSFKVGGEASVAAGPVGAGAGSTVTADLISFTRARGVSEA